MRFFTFLATASVLAGCVTVTPINRGAGQPAEYLIQCGTDAARCFTKANQACPRGYDVIDQGTETGPYTGAVVGGVASFGAAVQKHLQVRCI